MRVAVLNSLRGRGLRNAVGCQILWRPASWTHRRHLSTTKEDVVIVSAVRTPIGAFGGGLKRLTVTDLGALAIKEAVARSGIPGADYDDCYMGLVLAAGAQQTPARQALLKAGLPETVESTTVNKACASGMKAVMIGAQTIMLGHQKVVIGGGMESMSNVPFILKRKTLEWKENKLHDCLVHDGVYDPGLGILMGDCCENTNKKMGISRQEQDAFCIESYKRSARAWQAGTMAAETFPVEVKTRSGVSHTVEEDEEFRNLKLEKVSKLQPSFEKNGTITAANASKINDAACAVVMTSRQEAEKRHLAPLARIVSFADAATFPIDFPVAPALAVEKLLQQTGVSKGDVTRWEINEAFSGVVLAVMRLLGLDHDTVNVDGGAVSLGHPVGASGARLVTHLAHTLEAGQLGVAAICNGGGAASAILIEGMRRSGSG